MLLRDYLEPRSINVDLQAPTKEAVLDEMVGLLGLDDGARQQLARLLKRREILGSTGVGRGIAIPHCRSLAISRLRLAFGVHRAGLEFDAVDNKPVHSIFLIVAPPNEVSNQYLPVLGKIAQFAQMPDVADQLAALSSPEQLLQLLEQKGF